MEKGQVVDSGGRNIPLTSEQLTSYISLYKQQSAAIQADTTVEALLSESYFSPSELTALRQKPDITDNLSAPIQDALDRKAAAAPVKE